MSWELTRDQLLRDISAPVTRAAASEPIDTFDRDVCARIDTTGPGWGGPSDATPEPVAADPTPVVPVESLRESNPRSASASGEFVIGGEAREKRTTLVYGETGDDATSTNGVGAAYAIGPGPSGVEITVQGSGAGASMPTSAPVVLDDDGPDEIAGDGPTPAQPLSLDDIAAPPAFGTQAPTTDGSFVEPKLEGALVGGATEPPGSDAAPELAASVEPGAPMTVAESADAPVPVGEVPAEAVPQIMPDPVPEAIPDSAAPVASAAVAVAAQANEVHAAVDAVSSEAAPIAGEAANAEGVTVEQASPPADDSVAASQPQSAADSHSEPAPETSKPALADETAVDGDESPGATDPSAGGEPADQDSDEDGGTAEAAVTPSLFIPLSLMRPVIEEVDEPPVGDVAALAQEPGGEPEPVAASDSGAEELEEVEEFEEVQEAEEPIADAEAGTPGPPAKPPAPPEARRKRAWYDDVFGEHFQEIAPARSFEAAERDVEFLEAALDLPPGGSVLDVGCGGGRHAIALGKRGFEVTGIDSALSQLLAAGQNLESVDGPVSVSFMHGDMRSLPADRDFDAIVCLGTTFGYFEEEQNRLCAEGMRERLREGGKLVLQVFNRDFLAHHLPCRSWWQGKKCMVLDEAEMNFFANRLRVHRTVIFEDGRQFEHYMFIRAFTVHDLGKMLSAIGMKVLEVSGSRETRGRFYGADSPEIWIVAERKPD